MDVEVICIDDDEEDGEIFSQQEEPQQEPAGSGPAAGSSSAPAAESTTIDRTASAEPAPHLRAGVRSPEELRPGLRVPIRGCR